MPKTYYVGGPICWEDHYNVSRVEEIDSIVQKLLSEDNYILLHAHRQAGKSSMLLPISEALQNKDHIVINISLQGLGAQNFWKSLCELINIVYPVAGCLVFDDAAGFEKFLAWGNFEKDLYLLLDEIDALLNIPDICNDFLSALRAMKTMRCTNAEHTFALAGILGIGVFHVEKLRRISNISPFNTSELFRLSQPSEEAVSQMFASYGSDIGKDMTLFGHDIYGRTRGHLGLTSLLGKILLEWVGLTNDITIGGWIAHLCNSSFAGQLSQFPSIATICPSLSVSTNISRGARDAVRDLLHNAEIVADPSHASFSLREVIDYLEIEGIVVRIEVGGSVKVRFAAPLFRVVLLSYFNSVDESRVPNWVQLPMKNGSSRQLELLSCVRQSLPFMDRKRIYDQTYLNRDRTPAEFSFHFELYRVLFHTALSMGWIVTSENRNAAEGMRNRLNIYVANNSSRYGFEVTANATEVQLSSHYEDQSMIYKEALNLDEVMLVNFISEIPVGSRPEWWFITDDPAVSIVHVLLPKGDSVATIIKTLNPEDDEVIDLISASTVRDAAVDEGAQHPQLSDNRIHELSWLSVGGFVFEISQYENLKDLAKDLKEEIVGSTDDDPLRFFSIEKNGFIASKEVGSLTNKMYGKIEARHKEKAWTLLFS